MAIIQLMNRDNGRDYDIDTDGTWHNFRAGDVITCDVRGALWENKRIHVQGTRHSGDGDLVGIIEGESEFLFVPPNEPSHLFLLERPSLPFKVGDRVIWLGEIGTVIVLDPIEKNIHKFLVEFSHWHGGNDGNLQGDWNKPWYPTQHKTESYSRLWCRSDRLTLAPPETEDVAPTRTDNTAQQEERFFRGQLGKTGQQITIDVQGTRFGFRNNDVIRLANDETEYRVYGIEANEPTLLLVTPRRNPSRNNLQIVTALISDTPPPNSVILLERPACAGRPGLKFKVGDKVRLSSSELQNYTGTVVAITPDSSGCPYVVHVENVHGYLSLHHKLWWIPTDLPASGLFWMSEQSMELKNEMDSDKTGRPTVTEDIEESPPPPTTPRETSSGVEAWRASPPIPIMLNARILWREFKTRIANNALPVFDPLKITRENGLIIDCGEPEAARNMENCLYKLGATIFHLLYDESEFNDEKYDAEPEATYGARLQKDDDTDDLIRFLLFGKPRSPEEVETRFELQMDEEQPPAAIPEVLPAEPETSLSANNAFERALATLQEQGLDAALADRIAADPILAQFMIQSAKSKT